MIEWENSAGTARYSGMPVIGTGLTLAMHTDGRPLLTASGSSLPTGDANNRYLRWNTTWGVSSILFADLPTGTTSSTVAIGNHTHSTYALSSDLTTHTGTALNSAHSGTLAINKGGTNLTSAPTDVQILYSYNSAMVWSTGGSTGQIPYRNSGSTMGWMDPPSGALNADQGYFVMRKSVTNGPVEVSNYKMPVSAGTQNNVLIADANGHATWGSVSVSAANVTAGTFPSGAFVFQGNVTAPHFYKSSLRALKKDIKPLNVQLAFDRLMALEPVSYRWKANNEKDWGFIADDIAREFTNKYHTAIDYDRIITALVASVQLLAVRIQKLEGTNGMA